mmetsp:Transcript_116040/g.248106  ORF Transcript_116040/g.248106 Transcript_116040/m.248106 type:complete len:405 (-) Transcript_116040:191-1405(-)
MAEAAAPSPASGRATPFPSPPGLELTPGAPTTGDAQNGPSAAGSGSSLYEDVKQAVLRDVDLKVVETVAGLWQKGKQMLKEVQQKSNEKAEKLESAVSKCVERQRKLESDNEQLKQVLSDLAVRLTMLSTAMGGASASPANGSATCAATCTPLASPGATTAGGSSTASATPPLTNTQGSPSDFFGNGAACLDSYGALPEVPNFPFPVSHPQPAAAPLSLAEALSAQSPTGTQPSHSQPTPLSLVSSLPPSSAPEVFSFTLRKADENDLGLNVSHHKDDRTLSVEGVRAEGAVGAWNRQCLAGAFPEKAVRQGDKIISVNHVSNDPEKMLEECKEKHLLRLTIARGEGPPPEGVASQGVAGGFSPMPVGGLTPLRADASEFVPMGAASPAPTATASVAEETGAEA